jgi:hypothetical protein
MEQKMKISLSLLEGVELQTMEVSVNSYDPTLLYQATVIRKLPLERNSVSRFVEDFHGNQR